MALVNSPLEFGRFLVLMSKRATSKRRGRPGRDAVFSGGCSNEDVGVSSTVIGFGSSRGIIEGVEHVSDSATETLSSAFGAGESVA